MTPQSLIALAQDGAYRRDTKELGIGRPYLDRDPPHVGPIDGKEYADKRGRTAVQKAGLPTKNTQEVGLETKKHRVKIVATHRRVPQLETP
jgi:hypothetical protein